MLADANKGRFSAILIHKYDRVARSLNEHITLDMKLKKLNIELIAVAQDFGTSAEAKIMRSLMWSLSEYYIDNLASETKKGHKETALKGLHNGGVAPFGYDIENQKYIINELEAYYVRLLFQAALTGSGYAPVLQEMRDKGIKGKRGKELKYSQVYDILRNEKYTGVYLYSPTEEQNRTDRRSKPQAIRVEGAIPAIISKETFTEVQKIMDSRQHNGVKGDYLCSGLVYCSCGAKMHVITSNRKGHTYKYYHCSASCGAHSVRVDEIDKAAKLYLKSLLNTNNQALIAKAMQEYQSTENERLYGFYAGIKAEISRKEREYESLMDNLSSGKLPADVVSNIGLKMHDLQTEIQSLKDTQPPEDYTVDKITAWLSALRDAPDPAAVRLLIERIEVKNKTELNIISTLNSVLEKLCDNANFDRIEYPRLSHSAPNRGIHFHF